MSQTAESAAPLGQQLGAGQILDEVLEPSPLSKLRRRIFKNRSFLIGTLIILTILEELIIGWVHGESTAQVWGEFMAKSMLEILAPILVMFMVLIPLISFAELREALGPGVLKNLLLNEEKKPTVD